MCGRVFVIAVLAFLGVSSVAEETVAVAVGASAQLAKLGKHVVEAASDVTAAMPGAVNAGAVETDKGALVRSKSFVEAGKEQQEGEANEDQVADAEGDEEEEEEEEGKEESGENEEEDEDKEWDRLSSKEKKFWKKIGWSKKSWDGDEDAGEDSQKSWDELSRNQRADAKDLGFSKKTWDGLWDGLSSEDQKDWESRGWSKESWDGCRKSLGCRPDRLFRIAAARELWSEAGEKDWKDLSEEQQAALKALGYSQKIWDES